MLKSEECFFAPRRDVMYYGFFGDLSIFMTKFICDFLISILLSNEGMNFYIF